MSLVANGEQGNVVSRLRRLPYVHPLSPCLFLALAASLIGDVGIVDVSPGYLDTRTAKGLFNASIDVTIATTSMLYAVFVRRLSI